MKHLFYKDSVLLLAASESGTTGDLLNEFVVTRTTECARLGKLSYTIMVDYESLVIIFRDEESKYIFFHLFN